MQSAFLLQTRFWGWVAGLQRTCSQLWEGKSFTCTLTFNRYSRWAFASSNVDFMH